jgi:hypothetical protein
LISLSPSYPLISADSDTMGGDKETEAASLLGHGTMKAIKKNTTKALLDTSGNRNVEVCKFFSPY